jgi:hypothetical protein
VTRLRAVEGMARIWLVLVDGQQAAELGPGDTREFAVYPGRHRLEIQPGRPGRNGSTSFAVGPGQLVEFVARPARGLRLRPAVEITPASSAQIFGNPPPA